MSNQDLFPTKRLLNQRIREIRQKLMSQINLQQHQQEQQREEREERERRRKKENAHCESSILAPLELFDHLSLGRISSSNHRSSSRSTDVRQAERKRKRKRRRRRRKKRFPQ